MKTVHCERCHADRREETDDEGGKREFRIVRGYFVEVAGAPLGKRELVVGQWVWERIAAGREDDRYTFYMVGRAQDPWAVLAVLPGKL